MASDLKWKTGFGWGSVVMVILGALAALSQPIMLRVGGFVIAGAAVLYMLAQYRKWNGSPWRKIHFRGMLLYAYFAGSEAERNGHRVDDSAKVRACRRLALAMTGTGKEQNVDAMIEALIAERGSYLERLLRPRAATLMASVPPDRREAILSQVANLELGPDLVICNIVENTFGEEEAARYAFAICTGAAH